MSAKKPSADDILSDYVQNVRRIRERTADLVRMQHEHTVFLKEIAARIGKARRSMHLCSGYNP